MHNNKLNKYEVSMEGKFTINQDVYAETREDAKEIVRNNLKSSGVSYDIEESMISMKRKEDKDSTVDIESSYDLAKKLCGFGYSSLTFLNDEDDWCNFLVVISKFPFKLSIRYYKDASTQIKMEYLHNNKEIFNGELTRGYSLYDINTCKYDIGENIFDIVHEQTPADKLFNAEVLLQNDIINKVFDSDSINMIKSDECTILSDCFNEYGSKLKFSVPINEYGTELKFSIPIHESLILEVYMSIYETMSLVNIKFTIINIEDYSRIVKFVSYLYYVDEKVSINQIIKDMTSRVENKYEKQKIDNLLSWD